MVRWRFSKDICYYWPSRPIGLIEIIGGSYFSASPHISYRSLIEKLGNEGFAVHAYKYLPSLDHQLIANNAWKSFRNIKRELIERIGKPIPSTRIGHSLGCKLHLISPDGGRNCNSLISLSFNNFSANSSIPMFNKLSPKIRLKAEFSPSPYETLNIIQENYTQQKNLIIRFNDDKFDQSNILLKHLSRRKEDISKSQLLVGDHLTPISYGISGKFLGKYINNNYRKQNLHNLYKVLYKFLKNI